MIKFCCNFINSTKNKPSSLGWWLILYQHSGTVRQRTGNSSLACPTKGDPQKRKQKKKKEERNG